MGTDLEEDSQILTKIIENIIKEYTCNLIIERKKSIV